MSEDATLELSLLSIDALTSSATTKLIGKPKSLAAVVWVDPSLKKSAKPRHHNQVLHLPLSPQTLANPRSSLTVQILSSRLPFRLAKPLSTAFLPLSSIPPAGDVLTLPIWRPSGRLHGSLRISVRILWCLGAAPPPPANCVYPTALPMALEVYPAYPTAPPMTLEVYPAYPTAPPLPGRECASPVEIDMLSVCSGYPMASTLQDEGSEASEDLAGSVVLPEEDEGSNCASEAALPGPDRKSAWRSFLTGLVSGTVAAFVVVAAGLAEG